MSATHERVDLEKWIAEFPLLKLREEARRTVEAERIEQPEGFDDEEFERRVQLIGPGGDQLTSPRTLAIIEQLRREALDKQKWKTVPTDVFVFAKGEPSRREVTKVGGLPYWPAGKPWPLRRNGQPMSFIGQFNFTDSLDLVGHLPGDVLLLFLADEGVWPPIHHVWAKVTEQPLITPAAMPKTAFEFLPCYGAIHRSVDYPELAVDDELEGKVYQHWNVTVWEGTKIGGVPSGIQQVEENRGKFLCALGSPAPSDKTWPFLNVAEPFDYRSEEAERLLMWGDAGSLFIHIDRNGKVQAEMDCY